MLPRIFSDIVNGVWAIEKSYADPYIPIITNLLEGKTIGLSAQLRSEDLSEFQYENKEKKNLRYFEEVANVYQVSDYGQAAPPEQAPRNSIAIVNIIDVVTKYGVECGPSGMKTKGTLLQRCDANPNIKGIIINFDSPGGEGYAAIEGARVIQTIEKPVLGFADDLAASAACLLLLSCDWAVANSQLAKIGSIGTYVTIADYTEFYKQYGVKLIDVYADKSTDKNKAYKAALEGDLTLLKADLNKFNQVFLNTVAELRKGKVGAEKIWGTGKLFDAEEALQIGLIDEIATWEDTLLSFANSLNI